MTKETIVQIPDFVEDFEKDMLIDQDAEVEKLLGDEHTRGSNIWKVEELINGLATGAYPGGSHNQLSTIPIQERDSENASSEGSNHIMQQNRRMLERLYQRYEVDRSKAELLEKREGEYSTRLTSYATELGFSFIEEEIMQDGELRRFDVSIVSDSE